MDISPYSLGATLYMPATRSDILDVILHNKIPELRSLVICLEDAVSDIDVHTALDNLTTLTHSLADYHQQATTQHSYANRPLIFIRPRNIAMATTLLHDNQYKLQTMTGFVLPKFTLDNLPHWERLLHEQPFMCMPTLETRDVFDVFKMQQLSNTLAQSSFKEKIIALRIGGNDLMSVLGMRRSRCSTLYEGPLGYTIKMLVSVFGVNGFSLTSPVCELINNPDLLQQELQQDVDHGLVGKTAIHPEQIKHIHQAWQTTSIEFADAIQILNTQQSVYQSNGAMCEPATHRRWAKKVLDRRAHYGLKTENEQPIQRHL